MTGLTTQGSVKRHVTFHDLERHVTFHDLERHVTFQDLERHVTFQDLERHVTFQDLERHVTFQDLECHVTFHDLERLCLLRGCGEEVGNCSLILGNVLGLSFMWDIAVFPSPIASCVGVERRLGTAA